MSNYQEKSLKNQEFYSVFLALYLLILKKLLASVTNCHNVCLKSAKKRHVLFERYLSIESRPFIIDAV